VVKLRLGFSGRGTPLSSCGWVLAAAARLCQAMTGF